jgi:hypothetical protein
MNDILKELGVNEKYSKPVKIKKQFSKVKDNIPLKADYNFMADLLELPETKKGFKYLLVVVDLATDEFDIEPIKNKESLTVVDAIKKMFKRRYIKTPYASIKTDGGSEFKDAFEKYCYENGILHKIGISGRHQQLSNVERLNRELGRLIIGYLNSVEEKTFKDYKEWVEIVPKVRTMLNDFRKKPEGDPFTDIYQNFRMGDYRWDIMPRKIIRVLRYAGKVPIRYILENLPNVAYAEYELMPAKEKDALYIVESVKAKRTIRGVKQLLIKWKGYKKTEWQDYNQIKAQIPNIDKLYKRS